MRRKGRRHAKKRSKACEEKVEGMRRKGRRHAKKRSKACDEKHTHLYLPSTKMHVNACRSQARRTGEIPINLSLPVAQALGFGVSPPSGKRQGLFGGLAPYCAHVIAKREAPEPAEAITRGVLGVERWRHEQRTAVLLGDQQHPCRLGRGCCI